MLQRTPRHRPLAGLSILIVEDEPLVALDMHRVLSAAGGSIIAAATSGEAVRMLRFADVAAAVVDVQLGQEDATLICTLLAERRIPFVFYTGRLDTTLLRAQWPEVPVVKKPAREQDIVSILAALATPQVDR